MVDLLGPKARNEAMVTTYEEVLRTLDVAQQVAFDEIDKVRERAGTDVERVSASADAALQEIGALLVLRILRHAFKGDTGDDAEQQPVERDRDMETNHRLWRLLEASMDGKDPVGSVKRLVKIRKTLDGAIETTKICGGDREQEG